MQRIRAIGIGILAALVLTGVSTVGAQFMLTAPLVIDSPAFTQKIDGVVRDTFDASPVVVYTIPLEPQRICFIDIIGTAMDISGGGINNGAAGSIRALCSRGAGNAAVIASGVISSLSGFTAPQPTITLQANGGNIEIVATGKAQWLRWNLKIETLISK